MMLALGVWSITTQSHWLMVALLNPKACYGRHSGPWYDIFPDRVYFTFVPLVTQAYGDSGPAAPMARFPALMAAIVVASLVGMRISNRQQ